MNEKLVAPCGMNCAICKAYLRDKNRCHGCKEVDKNKPKTRFLCKIRICKERKGKYCFECKDFPCDNLRHLDKRYRTKYHMSMIENLNFIKTYGIGSFLENEVVKWRCSECGGVICCHNGLCFNCSLDKLRQNKKFRWGE